MEEEFDSTSVKKLVLKLGLPAMAAQFFNILYNIIDRIYVGNLPRDGELALASVGICAPALTVISAFAYLVGTGGSASMSIALGRRKRPLAQKIINNAFVMLLILSVGVTTAALLCKRPLLYLLGCSDAMYPFASRYFTIYICGTIAVLLGTGMNQFILAQGFSKQGMLSIVIGAISNVVLDPLFIFAFRLGIAGAATATVLSQFLSLGYVLHFLLGGKKVRNKAGKPASSPQPLIHEGLACFACRCAAAKQLSFAHRVHPRGAFLSYRRRSFLYDKKPGVQDSRIRIRYGGYQRDIMARILQIGMMPFLIMVLDNFIIIFLNASLRYHGGSALGDQYIACAAVVQSFMVIVTCPAQGITTGCGTLYSYHYGAGNYEKVIQVFRYVFLLCIAYIGFLFLLAQAVPQVFVRMFISGEENILLASSFVRKYTLGLFGIAVQYAIVDGLTAMGKIRYAMPISLFRKAMYLILIFALPLVTELKNIFYAGAVSDLLGSGLTVLVFFTVIKKKLRKELSLVSSAKPLNNT